MDRSVREEANYTEGHIAFLRQAFNFIRQHINTSQASSLAHPEYYYQKEYTHEESEITRIIDWDGVQTLPHALGFPLYPS